MTQRRAIAIVDDDPLIGETVNDLLDSAGYSSLVFASAERFLRSRRLGAFACLITDMRMPEMSGIELHRRLVERGHRIPTIIITAYPDELGRARAAKAGILCYLAKPFTSEALLGCIDSALGASTGGA